MGCDVYGMECLVHRVDMIYGICDVVCGTSGGVVCVVSVMMCVMCGVCDVVCGVWYVMWYSVSGICYSVCNMWCEMCDM